MTVNREVKGTLARLLATEDRVVEHRQCEPAPFDVERRVLTLPIWDKASENVYDMLVSHEVGHALYTPREWEYGKVPQCFLNVVEDARIEKLMKRRYQGLPKTFFAGYKELDEEDFFDVQGNVEKFALIDKINLFYKIGNYRFIPFTDEEQEYVDRVGKTETFEEVEEVALEIYNYMKEVYQDQKEEEAQENDSAFDLPSLEGDTPDMGDDSQDPFSEEAPIDSDSDDGTEAEGGDVTSDDYQEKGAGDEAGDPFQSLTDRAFTDKVKEYVQTGGYDTEYVEIGKVDTKKLVISWKEILKVSEERYHLEPPTNEHEEHRYNYEQGDIIRSEEEYREFFKQSQKEVNYLVKEFECRKSASAYARATTSRTGVLDTTKLHTYRYNEDLFKKITNIPEGKNHGMIFLLDWSGSMSNCLFDTMKQVLQLTWFCQKVQIPFRVYAFTNSAYGFTNYYEPTEDRFKEKEGHISFNKGFGLLEMLSSDASRKEQDRLALSLWRNAGTNSYVPKQWGRMYNMGCPPILSLSGTPLIEAVAAMQSVIPTFQKETGAEKISLTILSDGESAPPSYACRRDHLYSKYSDLIGDEPKLWVNSLSGRCQLRDRKTGRTYPKKDHPTEQLVVFLQNLKDSMPHVNILGFRLVAPRDVKQYFRLIQFMGFHKEHYEEAVRKFRKQKFYECKDSPYDKLYIMPVAGLSEETSLDDLKEDATKGQIGTAFKKMFRNKANNKKMLTSFAETVG